MKVMLIPLAMAAMFFKTGMRIQYIGSATSTPLAGLGWVHFNCQLLILTGGWRSRHDDSGKLSNQKPRFCQIYFVTGAGTACSGAGIALSRHAVYQRLSSICAPAARRRVVKSNAAGVPLPTNPPALSIK